MKNYKKVKSIFDEIAEELPEFVEQFKRSKKGNLWCIYEGNTLTIFKRADEYFAWCIADGDTTRFSKGKYENEDEALESLHLEINQHRIDVD